MKRFIRKQLVNIIFVLVLVLFTVFALLDVFVIPKKYVVISGEEPTFAFSFATRDPDEPENSTPGGTIAPVTGSPERTAGGSPEVTAVPATASPNASTEEPRSTDVPVTHPADPDNATFSPPATTRPASPSAAPTPTRMPTQEPTEIATAEPTPQPDLFTDGEEIFDENSYKNANINIKITLYREKNTDVHVAEVQLRTAEYFRTAFAKNTFGRNIKEHTSAIARANGAVFAINGDYYGARNSGYVIRNGVLYRDSSAGRDAMVLYYDGSVRIVREGTVAAKDLLNDGAWQTFTFGPGLISGGSVIVDEDDEVKAHLDSNPRTCIAMIEPLHYLIAVSDGRTSRNAGLTLYELANFMKSLGASEAYNMDGGGSSTMVFMDRVINQPTSQGTTIGERGVSDIVYFK